MNRSIKTIRDARRVLLAATVALCGLALLPATPAHADPRTAVICTDAPCNMEGWYDGDTVTFQWQYDSPHDLYNVRWSSWNDGIEYQTEVHGRRYFQIFNAVPNSGYTLKVQACTTHFLRSSDCTPWTEWYVDTWSDWF
jgi:hypothetical protein